MGPELLQSLDYVLMAYHGRHASSPLQAQALLARMVSHPYTDVIAHPDTFLGSFDRRACDWRATFQHMARCGVLCEYNLTTPLPPDLFEIARDQSDVRFVIGSDVHDFRQRSTRRITDAWSESEGGGFDLARAYLNRVLSRRCGSRELARLSALFETPEDLAVLEGRVYARRRRFNPVEAPFSDLERVLLAHLDAEPDDELDRRFLAHRMERFASVSDGRIVSTLAVEPFLDLIRANRRLRESPALG